MNPAERRWLQSAGRVLPLVALDDVSVEELDDDRFAVLANDITRHVPVAGGDFDFSHGGGSGDESHSARRQMRVPAFPVSGSAASFRVVSGTSRFFAAR